MPKFNLTDGEVKALVVFLKSRRGMNFSETSLERYRAALSVRKPDGSDESRSRNSPAPSLLAHGQQVIEDRACTACHKLGSKDGGIAPDLSYEGLRARRAVGLRPLQESALARARFHHAVASASRTAISAR